MSTPVPAFIPPKTRQWATSAIVLGILYGLMNLQNVFSYSMVVRMFGSRGILSYLVDIVDEIVAIAFIAGGVLTLKGLAGGRKMLATAAIAGIALTVLGSLWSWITYHHTAFSVSFTNASRAAQLPPNFGITVLSVAIILSGVIRVIYCFCLYRHMSAEPVAEAYPGYTAAPQDYGAWPPPPAG